METARNKTDRTPCPQELTVSSLYFPIVSPSLLGFHASSAGKESACSAGDSSSIPGSGRCPRGGYGYPLQLFLPGESPWTEEPGRLQSMGSQRVRHEWSDFTFTSILFLGNYSTDKLTPVCIGIHRKFSTALFSVRGKDNEQPKYLSKGK